MNAVRILRKLESDTLTLPELKPFVGKTVEIVVQEADPSADAAPYEALFALAGKDVVDPDAYQRLREASEL
ncbi:MAG: hypothetical protein WD066_19930 [Planctomycetaceae bacterium]